MVVRVVLFPNLEGVLVRVRDRRQTGLRETQPTIRSQQYVPQLHTGAATIKQ
jgi:hypothetical protein